MWNTPDLCDEFPNDVFVLPPLYQNYGGLPAFHGEVVTVKCFEDNSRVKELLEQPGEGKVIMVDGGGSLRCALIGDLMAASGIEQGWKGIIIHGCCRDVHDLENMPFGVRALASVPIRSTRKGLGEANIAIDMAGVRVEPGMIVYADQTGIVLSNKPLV